MSVSFVFQRALTRSSHSGCLSRPLGIQLRCLSVFSSRSKLSTVFSDCPPWQTMRDSQTSSHSVKDMGEGKYPHTPDELEQPTLEENGEEHDPEQLEEQKPPPDESDKHGGERGSEQLPGSPVEQPPDAGSKLLKVLTVVESMSFRKHESSQVFSCWAVFLLGSQEFRTSPRQGPNDSPNNAGKLTCWKRTWRRPVLIRH